MEPQQEQCGVGICTLGPKRPAIPGKPISPESPCGESEMRWGEWGQDKDAQPITQDLGACLLPWTSATPGNQMSVDGSHTRHRSAWAPRGRSLCLSHETVEASSGIP